MPEALEFLSSRSNAYVFPAAFYGDFPKKELLRDLLGFVVDIDDVSYAGLENLLDEFEAEPRLEPSYLVKTGGGYHLWYVFGDPVEYRKRWLKKVDEINDALYDFWFEHAGGCVCDKACRGIPHGFRPPGSLTKGGDPVVCFRRERSLAVSITDLADTLGVSLVKRDGGIIDFQPVGDEPSPTPSPVTRKGTARGTMRARNLYDWTLREVPQRTRKGNRYLSLFCLAGLAWGCGVAKEEVRRDLERVVADNWSNGSDPVRKHEIDSAMRGYCYDYATLRRSTREELLGWNYGPPQKRNYGDEHRTRSEHMEEVNEARRVRSITRLQKALKKNPDATKKELQRMTGLSYPTVLRYYDTARALSSMK
jgi:hypothetical protein